VATMSEIQDLKNHILSLTDKLNNLCLIVQNLNKSDQKMNEVLNIIHNLSLEKSMQNNKIFETMVPDIIRRITKLEQPQSPKEFKKGDYIIAFSGKVKESGNITSIDKMGLISINKGKLKFNTHQCRFPRWDIYDRD
jgi:hypothetical protein